MRADKDIQLIESIRCGKFSDKKLINLYKNASSRGVTAVAEAAKNKLRTEFPQAANRLFGAKEKEAVSILEDALQNISSSFNLSGNKLKNGVKAGGGMLKGEKYIDLYISYKNGANVGVFLGLVQDNAESEMFAKVGHYGTGANSFREEQYFQMGEWDKAVASYGQQLAKVLAR